MSIMTIVCTKVIKERMLEALFKVKIETINEEHILRLGKAKLLSTMATLRTILHLTSQEVTLKTFELTWRSSRTVVNRKCTTESSRCP